jgi:hypothetical protein
VSQAHCPPLPLSYCQANWAATASGFTAATAAHIDRYVAKTTIRVRLNIAPERALGAL